MPCGAVRDARMQWGGAYFVAVPGFGWSLECEGTTLWSCALVVPYHAPVNTAGKGIRPWQIMHQKAAVPVGAAHVAR
ncbi:hypothetical protein [Acetobacter pomorum]|uniref:hypothetical protein n=1 Tax=Acetobacter pomorum TaxID=65959 RepID=UPI00142DBA81|nr:hypothetical protein [Acetobacter pomorum]